MVTKPDVFDWLIFTGSVLVSVGLWLIYPPLAFIVLGVIAIGGGLYGSWRKGRVGDGK